MPMAQMRSIHHHTSRLALAAGALAFVLLALVAVPFVFFDPIGQSERLAQAHALLWLTFFSPVMAFPAMGHLLDQLIPLASADPRIALIPHFGLMFVVWSLLFFGVALGWRTLRRWRTQPAATGRQNLV
jgi:hypothetical protein